MNFLIWNSHFDLYYLYSNTIGLPLAYNAIENNVNNSASSESSNVADSKKSKTYVDTPSNILNNEDQLRILNGDEEIDNLCKMLQDKNEELTYNTKTTYSSGILGTDYTQCTIFIDYKNKIVGFLYGIDEFKSYQLKEGNNLSEDYEFQKEWNLKGLGKTLTTYSLDEENFERTIAIKLKMTDGSVYIIDNINEEKCGENLSLY